MARPLIVVVIVRCEEKIELAADEVGNANVALPKLNENPGIVTTKMSPGIQLKVGTTEMTAEVFWPTIGLENLIEEAVSKYAVEESNGIASTGQDCEATAKVYRGSLGYITMCDS